MACSKGCVHAVMHLNLSVAMETIMLQLGFIHCHFYINCVELHVFSVREKKQTDPEL